MARDQAVVECPPGVWTELTDSDVTQITFQVLTGVVEIRATDGTAPSASDRGFLYRSDGYEYHEGELRISVSDLAEATGVDRVFARPLNARPAKLIVDHA